MRNFSAILLSLILFGCEHEISNPQAYKTPCETDEGCRTGYYCSSNKCEPLQITPLCVDGDRNCGSECSTNNECAEGLFCGESTGCTKLCVQDEISCSNLGICMEDGRCISTNPPDPTDAQVYFDAEIPDANETCASVTVQANPVIPTVILIIDQSLSMDTDFMGAGTRWNVLRDFLLETDGLIASLQDRVRFGISMYSAISGPGGLPEGDCPLVTSVSPTLNNYDSINQTYSTSEPIMETPTGDAIDSIVDNLTIDPENPTIFIVATDGEPDRCEELNPQNGQEEAISAVERAYDLGITSYVISVGTQVSNQHLQDLANAGIGTDQDAEFWIAGDSTTLETALTSVVVENTLSCDIELEGEITEGDACAEGTVTLNGTELVCGDPNGWQLLDNRRILLVGNACDELRSGKEIELEATFSCLVTITSPI